MPRRGASIPSHLVKCSPCEHGKDLGVKAVLPGSTVWSPKCADSKGNMRRHDIPSK
jgi:hypothetical protein